jgi:hypothetical protein
LFSNATKHPPDILNISDAPGEYSFGKDYQIKRSFYDILRRKNQLSFFNIFSTPVSGLYQREAGHSLALSKLYENQTVHVNPVTKFLWWCGGAVTDLLEDCSTEKVTYQGIGAAVLFTAILAALTGGYGLFFVFDSIEYSVLFGIFWGLLIFNLDRYIVSNINKSGGFFRQMLVAIPRVFLAVCIAFIISKPLELRIFEKEIEQKLDSDYRETMAKYGAAIAEQDKILSDHYLKDVQDEIKITEAEILRKKHIIDDLNEELIKEIQGINGIRGDGPAAQQIRNYLYDSKAELENLKTRLMELRSRETVLQKKKESDLEEKYSAGEIKKNEGLLSRLNALEALKEGSKTTYYADLFIFALFLFIEVAPVFIKIFSSKGIYDELEAKAALLEKEDILQNLSRRYR